jgi:hypothetical protein
VSTLISIDFDFLVPHGMFEDEIRLPAYDTSMPGMLVYDWQMSEGRHPVMDRSIWESRYHNFKRWGLDIQELTKPTMPALDFMTEISVRLDGEALPAWKADSHAWAAIVCRDFSKRHGPLSVINFDAHHDLGYGDDPLEKVELDQVECDNWVLFGLREGWIKDYTLVYPDWLGRAEWEGVKRPHLKEWRKQISVTTWSEWLQKTELVEEPEAGFLCRSSAWIPPWLDTQFQELCDEWGYADCLDCEFGQHSSPYDVCTPRDWDWEQVEKEIAEREENFRILREMNA